MFHVFVSFTQYLKHFMLVHISFLLGFGAGHSIEDANVLGLTIRDYLRDPTAPLSTYTSLYQAVRLPRAQKAQITTRQAGDVYEMQGLDFHGLSYEECLPIVADKLRDRMTWVCSGDIEAKRRVLKWYRNESLQYMLAPGRPRFTVEQSVSPQPTMSFVYRDKI
jgi:2-polyprenyl-6-methoxyphenol hydroxylase-like FAD-dependent oxidoreductase